MTEPDALQDLFDEEFGDQQVVVLPYQSPHERALATLRRGLVIDAIGVAVATLATIPVEGAVPWRAIGLGAALLLAKSLAQTFAKYDRALAEEGPEVPDGI